MDYFLLYLILRLDVISSAHSMLAIVAGILFVVALGISVLHGDEDICDHARPWIKRIGIPFVIVLFLAVIIPNTKQAAVIYCLPKIINNEQVQKVPDNLLRLANQWIDDQITETTETVAKTVIESVEN